MFIDMHCHILPGLDDGAESVNDFREMASLAYDGGTTIMVATPHYMNSAQCTAANSKESILRTYRLMKEETQRNNIPINLYLGSEMLCGAGVNELYSENKLITINNTRYILVEFRFDDDIHHVEFCLNSLISCGLVPIIAHPERYTFFRDYPYGIYKCIEMGCKMQINKGSVFGKYGEYPKKYAKWLLSNNLVHLIASDCHDTVSRTPYMGDIYEWMLTRFSRDRINELLHDNQKKILLDKTF